MKKIIFILFFHLFALQGFANVTSNAIAAHTHKDSIFGRITDAANIPIIGVNVYCKKNKYGTITNFDGEFSLAKEKKGSKI